MPHDEEGTADYRIEPAGDPIPWEALSRELRGPEADEKEVEDAVPHVCPVCGGSQTVDRCLYDRLPGGERVDCRTCEGTGIVWG